MEYGEVIEWEKVPWCRISEVLISLFLSLHPLAVYLFLNLIISKAYL